MEHGLSRVCCDHARCGRLNHELIKAYGLNQHLTMCACRQQWAPLTAEQAGAFHTDHYIQFLQLLDYNGLDAVEDAPNFVLNPSVCFCETTWCASAPRSTPAATARRAALALSRLAAGPPCWWPSPLASAGAQTHAMLASADPHAAFSNALPLAHARRLSTN